MAKVSCKRGCISTGFAIQPRKEALPSNSTLVGLDLDWWAQDHKDVTSCSKACRGWWGLEHRPARRGCKSFSSLEKKREKKIAWESVMAMWTGEAQTGPASPWRCVRLG